MNTIVYEYRGGVERVSGNTYQWFDGYSERNKDGAITYPWMTARECQKDARNRGAVAKMERAPGRILAK